MSNRNYATLVSRLRYRHEIPVCREAADEIERLRHLLDRIAREAKDVLPVRLVNEIEIAASGL